jgi:two-component system, chemotaxis family, chemotaxis protein CheY
MKGPGDQMTHHEENDMRSNILIVDDSQIIRSIIARIIDMASTPVDKLFFASNGTEALEILGRRRIDLVFTGINMPVMDGIALIEKMNTNLLMRRIPIVVVSAEACEKKFEKLEAAENVRAVVRKPFRPETIRDVVKDILFTKQNNDYYSWSDLILAAI